MPVSRCPGLRVEAAAFVQVDSMDVVDGQGAIAQPDIRVFMALVSTGSHSAAPADAIVTLDAAANSSLPKRAWMRPEAVAFAIGSR